MIELSVVVITRNQEWNVARLIESVLEMTSSAESREIILVDSASTDKTTEIASRYPMRVVRLHPDQHLCAAAGRYVGYQQTTGRFVLFLDGDMELCPGWYENALAVMKSAPDIGVMTGILIFLLEEQAPHPKPPLEAPAYDEIADIEHSGGVALYRRSVLEQVGSFNPYLISDEEPELCLRIRSSGYRVVQNNRFIAYHYGDAPVWSLAELVNRRRRRLYLGYGQMLRYNLGKSSLLLTYVRERGYIIAPLIALLVGIASLLQSLVTRRWIWFGSWLAMLGVVFAADSYRRRDPMRTAAAMVNRVFVIEGTIKGLLMTPLDPATYPGRFDVIKWVD